MQLRFLGTFFIGCGLASAQGLLDLAADKPVSDPICPRFLQNLDTKGGTGVAVSGLTSRSRNTRRVWRHSPGELKPAWQTRHGQRCRWGAGRETPAHSAIWD